MFFNRKAVSLLNKLYLLLYKDLSPKTRKKACTIFKDGLFHCYFHLILHFKVLKLVPQLK